MRVVLAIAIATGAGCHVLFPLTVDPPDDARVDDAPTDTPADTDDAMRVCALACPANYVAIAPATSMYQILMVPQASFVEAEATCEATLGNSPNFTHLAVLDDQPELDALAGAVSMFAGNFRLGHRRDLALDVSFLPVTTQPHTFPPNTPSVSPWAAGEPDSTSHCAELPATSGGDLVAGDCETARPYICECDCYPPKP